MDINQSAIFFVGSILICFGFSVVAITVLFLNNIYSKYWKPIEWRIFNMIDYHNPYAQEPQMETKKDDKSADKART
jgi:hypothetical protein